MRLATTLPVYLHPTRPFPETDSCVRRGFVHVHPNDLPAPLRTLATVLPAPNFNVTPGCQQPHAWTD